MIEVRDLTVEVDGRTLLSHIDLALGRGEIVGLIGPPESGKTVLLKSLAGLIQPTHGSIRSHDMKLRYDHHALVAWQSRIGMAFQNDALFDAMTVFDNVAFPLRRLRRPEEEIRKRVAARLASVGLDDCHDRSPSEISGGMRKRVGIARATVIEPEVGLFDDPIAGLDPVTGARILDLIVGLNRTLQMATVVISNDLAVLLPICNRVVMLHEGRIVHDDTADALLSSPQAVVVQFATGGDEGPL